MRILQADRVLRTSLNPTAATIMIGRREGGGNKNELKYKIMIDRILCLNATDRNHQAVIKVHARVTSFGASDSIYGENNNAVFFCVEGFLDPNDFAAQVANVNGQVEEMLWRDPQLRNARHMRDVSKNPYRALNFAFEYNGRTYTCIFRTECDFTSARLGSVSEIDINNIDENSFKDLRFELAH